MKQHFKIIIIFSLIFLTNTNCYGETNKLRVVHTDWFPYTFQENGKSAGFEIDIFNAVMEIMDIKVEFTNYPWQRCLNAIKTGKADILISLLRTDERENFTYFPDEHISLSKTVFFTKKDKNIIFNGNYKDLKDYSIGVIAGFSYGDIFDKADYLRKDKANSIQMLILKLVGGRNDLAAENQAVISANAKKMGLENKIKFLKIPIHFQKLYVGFSKTKKQKKLCKYFSKHLQDFKGTELYESILKKYGIIQSDMGE
jgi:polar amino acid transport system substrate-binding protein